MASFRLIVCSLHCLMPPGESWIHISGQGLCAVFAWKESLVEKICLQTNNTFQLSPDVVPPRCLDVKLMRDTAQNWAGQKLWRRQLYWKSWRTKERDSHFMKDDNMMGDEGGEQRADESLVITPSFQWPGKTKRCHQLTLKSSAWFSQNACQRVSPFL